MYTKEIKLKDNQIPATINVETGEIKEFRQRPNNIPEGKEVFEPTLTFSKTYSGVLEYLTSKLTPKEVVVVLKMISLAKMNTNYLKPLHAESTIKEISETLEIHRNNVNKIMDTLYRHGIYGKASTMGIQGKEKHWLILNPYISFKGKTIKSSTITMFSDTLITEYVKTYKR